MSTRDGVEDLTRLGLTSSSCTDPPLPSHSRLVVTSVGIEITRSSQRPPFNTEVPLAFAFTLLDPGIEVAMREVKGR